MADIDHQIRELGLLNQVRRNAAGGAAVVGAGRLRLHGLKHSLGTRVLDLVTGEQGVIVDGKSEHVITNGTTEPKA